MSYIRIHTTYIHWRTGKPVGIFGACHHLKQRGWLNDDEIRLFEELDAWFIEHLPEPAYYRDGNPQKAVTWFKSSAVDMVERCKPMIELLDKYCIEYRISHSDNPGKIIYEDEFQVAVL